MSQHEFSKTKSFFLNKRKTGRRRKHKGTFLFLKKEKEKQMRNADFLYEREYVKGKNFSKKKNEKRKTKSKRFIKKRHTFNMGKKEKQGKNRN